MAETSRLFAPRNSNAYADPRSHIVFDDAKTFFSTSNRRYDIIVSEPSNPWVSGVASLFTEEFYGRLAASLNDGGVMSQWLHTYEMDEATLASIFGAVSRTFPDFVVYSTNDSDVVLIARKGGAPGRFDPKVLQWPALKVHAERLQIADGGAIDRRLLGDAAAVHATFDSYRAPANSDYFPVVDQQAARTRFMDARVTALTSVQMSTVPLLEMLDGTFRPSSRPPTTYAWSLADSGAQTAWALRATVLGEKPPAKIDESRDIHHQAAQLVRLWGEECPKNLPFEEMLPNFVSIAGASPQLPPDAAVEMWKSVAESNCARRASAAQRTWFALFTAVAARDPDAMSEAGSALLEAARGQRSAATEYAFLAAVTGNACRGRVAAADKLFEEGTREWLRPNMHQVQLNYLYSAAHAPARNMSGRGCVTAQPE